MTDAAMPAPATETAELRGALAGILWGLGAAAIWSGWWVMTRASVTAGLTGPDLAALRFGVGGLLLLPVLWRNRAGLGRVPPGLLAVMAAGAGAPYALVAGFALRFASAGNGGALTLGMLPAFTALLSALVLGERIGPARAAGLAVIVTGALTILAPGLGVGDSWIGHVLFMLGAAMWAGFSVAMRLSGLSPMAATAVVCVFSAAGYLPVYLTVLGPAGLLAAPAGEIAIQGVYQGGLSAIGALFCYCQAIRTLGTTRAAIFAALVPVLATAMGAVLLGESPSGAELAGVALLSLGIYAAAQAPSSPAAGMPRFPRCERPNSTADQPVATTPAHDLADAATRNRI